MGIFKTRFEVNILAKFGKFISEKVDHITDLKALFDLSLGFNISKEITVDFSITGHQLIVDCFPSKIMLF